MPRFDWQLIVVVLALAAATAHLVWRGIRTWQTGRDASAGACGSCGSCSAENRNRTGTAHRFVPLEMLNSPTSSSNDGDNS